MKKGFTLIELILVIALLSILATISIISINRITLKIKQEALDSQYKMIEIAAENYVSNNLDTITDKNMRLTIEELSDSGYLKDKDIKNSVTGEDLTGCVTVRYNNN